MATGIALFLVTRRDLMGKVEEGSGSAELSAAGLLALSGVGVAVLVLLVASACRVNLGAPTLALAAVALGLVMIQDRRALWETPKHVSWSVIPLAAGLFVVVEAVNRVGALDASREALAALGKLPPWQGDLAGAFGITAVSNVVNNLPQRPRHHRRAGDEAAGDDPLAHRVAPRKTRDQRVVLSKIGLVVTSGSVALAVLASTFLQANR